MSRLVDEKAARAMSHSDRAIEEQQRQEHAAYVLGLECDSARLRGILRQLEGELRDLFARAGRAEKIADDLRKLLEEPARVRP